MINKFLCLALILLSHTAALLGGHELKQFSKIFSGYHCIPAIAEIIDGYVGTDDNCPKLDACTCDDGRGVDRKDCKCGADHEKRVTNKHFYYKTDEYHFTTPSPLSLAARIAWTRPFAAVLAAVLPTITIDDPISFIMIWPLAAYLHWGLIWNPNIDTIYELTGKNSSYSCRTLFYNKSGLNPLHCFKKLIFKISGEKFLKTRPPRFLRYLDDLKTIDCFSFLDGENLSTHTLGMRNTSEDKTIKVVASKSMLALYHRSPFTMASLVRINNQNVEKLRLANKLKAIAIVGGLAFLTLLGRRNKGLVSA